MARRRFFVQEVRNGAAEVTGDDAAHLTRVLRVEAGQRYEISDNRNVYVAEIETARKSLVVFRIAEKLPHRNPSVHITLCAALFKFDHFEWMVEKATELGVSVITPFVATRSERGLDRAAEKRVERWRRIAVEASQQSRRDFLPEIDDPAKLAGVLPCPADCRLFLDEDPAARPILATLPPTKSTADRVALALGPEGGWTSEERAAFAAAGWLPVSLSDSVLRAETAAIAGLSIVSAAWR